MIWILLYIFSIPITWLIQRQIMKYDSESPKLIMFVVSFIPIINIITSLIFLGIEYSLESNNNISFLDKIYKQN